MSNASSSRREFVKTGTVAAVGLAASGGGAIASDESLPRASQRKVLTTDVLVCGAGCAGTAAALSAARQGVRVLLIEKAPFAGGILTSVGLPYFDGIANIADNRIVVR
ncbi:MAG: FAD-dependent oxidoreductase, partial [Planctomycetales bacterium]|nr:FAD-dependent oxidoreductase [Planctomycetales bacterium]